MVLENKLNITDEVELAREEEKISKKKANELFENGYLQTLEPGTFECLSKIHKYLFEEIYSFAGEIRKVNISKGNFRFAPITYLETALNNIEKMPQSTFDEIIEKYVEIKQLLKEALTDKINDREVYRKGIDASYFYEGYTQFKTEDL